MKKVIITLIVAFAAAFSAHAQFWAGGSVGYSYRGGEHYMNISPEVGYNLNDSWSVAGALNFSLNAEGGTSMLTLGLTPYARYTFWRSGIVSAFVDGGLALELYHNAVKDDLGNKYSTDDFWLGIGVRPGIAIALNEKLSFVTHTGFLGVETNFDAANFGLGVGGDEIALGLYYAF